MEIEHELGPAQSQLVCPFVDFVNDKNANTSDLLFSDTNDFLLQLCYLCLAFIPTQTNLSSAKRHHPGQDIVFAIEYLSSLGH